MTPSPTSFISRSSSGILLVVVALALAAFGGGLMKSLTDDLAPVVIAWIRFTGSFAILLPLVLWHHGRAHLLPARPVVQTIRGLLLVLGNLAFIFGVQGLDYANAIAILYVYPFIMVFLAPFLLGERVGLTGWVGVIGGFAGVLLVMRPSVTVLNYHALFVIAAGTMIAVQMLLNRMLGARSHPMVIAMWGCLVASLAITPFVPFFWTSLSGDHIGTLLVLVVTSALSQTMMVLGMGRAAAGDVAPFTYTEIVSGIAIGFFMFGTLPDAVAIIGMALIIASGILVARMRRS